MEYELLNRLIGLLKAAGLRAGEEYPSGERMEVQSPAAAVGLRELDAAAGEICYTVRVLTPRIVGGWNCQVWAAQAQRALCDGGMTVKAGEMEYLSGSDCFSILLEVREPVVFTDGGWKAGSRWQILCGGQAQQGVEGFQAVRSLGRRLVGEHYKSAPVAVSPGSGGWTLELIQWAKPEPVAEPFVLTVRSGSREIRYTGCCWDEERWEYTQQGARLTRRGFALAREEEDG